MNGCGFLRDKLRKATRKVRQIARSFLRQIANGRKKTATNYERQQGKCDKLRKESGKNGLFFCDKLRIAIGELRHITIAHRETATYYQ